jgi:hypothetical protein
MDNGGMYGGWAHLAQGQGFKVKIAMSDELLLVLLVLVSLFIISFGTGKAHVPFIDAIFAEVLFT